MKVTTYKVPLVTSQSHDLFALLDTALPSIPEGSVVAIAAKIVSLCEGRVVDPATISKDDLIRQESQYYIPRNTNTYEVSFAITHNFLIASAGIDESNANDQYILWPKDPQASANAIWEHLRAKHNLRRIGVIITDSTTRAMQWGTTGIAVAHCGFKALKSYIGTPDLFDRPFMYHTASISNGLAASAVTPMGEGREQTPVVLVEDVPFVDFQDHIPDTGELSVLRIEREEDIFWPLYKDAPWLPGEQQPT